MITKIANYRWIEVILDPIFDVYQDDSTEYYSVDTDDPGSVSEFASKVFLPVLQSLSVDQQENVESAFRYNLVKYPYDDDQFWKKIYHAHERLIDRPTKYRQFYHTMFCALFPQSKIEINPAESFVESDSYEGIPGCSDGPA